MTVTATSYTPLTYNGNGSTTVFNVTFQFFELAVYHIDSSGTETLWAENTHYTVTGGEGSTGSITVSTSPTDYTPASGESIRIERVTSKDQPRDYDLDNAVLEAALQQSDDRLAMILQELDYDNRRRPAISKANYTAEVEFPAASTGSVLSWAADGNLVNTALLDLDGVAISALTTTTSLEDTDLLPLYDNSAGDNAAITWANVKTSLSLGALSALDTVDTDQIGSDAVTTAKIVDDAITLAKLEHGTGGDILYYGASGEPFRLPKGTENHVLTQGAEYPEWGSPSTPLFHVQDQKSSGTDGGTFTSGSWQTRTLNTSVTNEITSASLSSNQITLPAGEYIISAKASAFRVGYHKLKLRNITDSTDALIGSSEYSGNISNGTASNSYVLGKVSIAGTKVFELQHRSSGSFSSTGYGLGIGVSVVEVYAEIFIQKVV